jgi:hypothetical protein
VPSLGAAGRSRQHGLTRGAGRRTRPGRGLPAPACRRPPPATPLQQGSLIGPLHRPAPPRPRGTCGFCSVRIVPWHVGRAERSSARGSERADAFVPPPGTRRCLRWWGLSALHVDLVSVTDPVDGLFGSKVLVRLRGSEAVFKCRFARAGQPPQLRPRKPGSGGAPGESSRAECREIGSEPAPATTGQTRRAC